MERREFLSRGGLLLGVGALGGCTEERLSEAEREPPPLENVSVESFDLPVEQRLGAAEAGIERATGQAFADLDGFGAYLTGAGVDVETLAADEEAGEPVVSLESVFAPTAEKGFMHHLGVVAGGYAVLIAADHESETLNVTLLDAESNVFGEYELRRHWAAEYNDGELTAREYASEIAVTAKSV